MSQFWTEDILQKLDLTKSQRLNDSFTPSGLVHMGSPISPTIHDALRRRIEAQGCDVVFSFGFDDFDVIDGLPDDQLASHEQYMGVPLFIAPPPPGSTAASFADHYLAIYQELMVKLGIAPVYYRTSEMYRAGVFNPYIRRALDGASSIRRIYQEVSGSSKGDDWHPLQVICEHCGKLGTTKVTGWDGTLVSYQCDAHLVAWAKGCGHTGTISPFGGTAKMPWRVEWASKWTHFGVTLEAAGKDHASKGGSFDVSGRICQEVFEAPGPLKVAHEFLLWEGKKMASSKGIGVSGQEFFSSLPQYLIRYYYLRTKPNAAIEVRPMHETMPRLFDDFDRLSANVLDAPGSSDDADRLLWELSTLLPITAGGAYRTVRFSTIAQWVQMPHIDMMIEAARHLGILVTEFTPQEQEILQDKAKYAALWLERYALADEKFDVLPVLPKVVLSHSQRQFLAELAQIVEDVHDPVLLEAQLYALLAQQNMSSKEAFVALYQVLLGKNSGPKAAWLMTSLDSQFVAKRLREGSDTP